MNTKNPETLAMIGSGASVVFLLKHIQDNCARLSSIWQEITIFEKDSVVGMGMPYNPKTTNTYNLSNISSEEIPELKISFANWLKQEKPEVLKTWGVTQEEVSDKKVYSRLALGKYLSDQFKGIVCTIEQKGIEISIRTNTQVIDIKDIPRDNNVQLTTYTGNTFIFNKVLIATGHHWTKKDDLVSAYFKSPWPIFKILPKSKTYYNFTIGILGASLSAVDVVTSLAHRHGIFINKDGQLKFNLEKDANNFKIVMHDANGWLPHLQYEQKEPLRKIYRHADRKSMLDLIDNEGYLRLETYFDIICRPVLKKAFLANDLFDMVSSLSNPDFKLGDFIEKMSERHHYDNAFEGMRNEMLSAKKHLQEDTPIYWKEALDDLMFTLNWHAELLPAEDHLYFQVKVSPFLMNVISALPLDSAKILLALYDAGVLDLVAGKITQITSENEETKVTVAQKDTTVSLTYKMFVECAGDKIINIENYPFQTLVNQNVVRAATANYANKKISSEALKSDVKIFKKKGGFLRQLDGIDIDPSFRIINKNGKASNRIFDLTFTHLSGLRPYSYGLQACNATAAIFINAMIAYGDQINCDALKIEEVSKLYASI